MKPSVSNHWVTDIRLQFGVVVAEITKFIIDGVDYGFNDRDGGSISWFCEFYVVVGVVKLPVSFP